jgi:hypothetical protein
MAIVCRIIKVAKLRLKDGEIKLLGYRSSIIVFTGVQLSVLVILVNFYSFSTGDNVLLSQRYGIGSYTKCCGR